MHKELLLVFILTAFNVSSEEKPHIVFINIFYKKTYDIDLTQYNVTAINTTFNFLDLDEDVKSTINCFHFIEEEKYDLSSRYDDILQKIIESSEKYGDPICIVSSDERAVLLAAMLREHYGISGTNMETAILTRDKYKFRQRLFDCGLDTTAFRQLTKGGASYLVDELFEQSKSGKIVLKPKNLAGSNQIQVFSSSRQAKNFIGEAIKNPEEYMIEEYIEGNIYHVDGFVRNGRVQFYLVSKYINTCLDHYQLGTPIISIIEPKGITRQKIAEFNKIVIAMIGLEDSAFHHEVFVNTEGKVISLEIASRVGGAIIPSLVKLYSNVNLYEEQFRACMQLEKKSTVIDNCNRNIGGISFNAKIEKPMRVSRIDFLSKDKDKIIEQKLVKSGQVLKPCSYAPRLPVASFILEGSSYEELLASLKYLENHVNIQLTHQSMGEGSF